MFSCVMRTIVLSSLGCHIHVAWVGFVAARRRFTFLQQHSVGRYGRSGRWRSRGRQGDDRFFSSVWVGGLGKTGSTQKLYNKECVEKAGPPFPHSGNSTGGGNHGDGERSLCSKVVLSLAGRQECSRSMSLVVEPRSFDETKRIK